jgi:anti-sigma B factor antagonist
MFPLPSGLKLMPEMRDVYACRMNAPRAGGSASGAPLSFSVSLGPGYAVVAVSGEIDMTVAAQFRERLASVLTGGVPRMVVDLSGVPFMDSAGLGVLTGLHRVMTSQGGLLVLASPRQAVARVLSLTDVDQVIPVVASVAETLAAWTRDDDTVPPESAG